MSTRPKVKTLNGKIALAGLELTATASLQLAKKLITEALSLGNSNANVRTELAELTLTKLAGDLISKGRETKADRIVREFLALPETPILVPCSRVEKVELKPKPEPEPLVDLSHPVLTEPEPVRLSPLDILLRGRNR